MKKTLIVLLSGIILLTSFTYFNSKDRKDPKEVAYNFSVALNNLNYEEAKKYGTPETGKIIDMLASFSDMMPDSVKEQTKNRKVEIKGIEENGDKCTVMVSHGSGEPEKVELIKQNGEWLVYVSKDEKESGAKEGAE